MIPLLSVRSDYERAASLDDALVKLSAAGDAGKLIGTLCSRPPFMRSAGIRLGSVAPASRRREEAAQYGGLVLPGADTRRQER